jgi:hypothetical protein
MPKKNQELEKAKVELGYRVYKAASYMETLESQGKICGNGHQMAQKVAKFAEELLEQQWK